MIFPVVHESEVLPYGKEGHGASLGRAEEDLIGRGELRLSYVAFLEPGYDS